MSILYAISIVYIAGEYCDPGFCTPIGVLNVVSTTSTTLLIGNESSSVAYLSTT